ncbi:MAG: LOG family protein [Candidatus Lindowbacteria bacterium]|nr:LOG family protein [Candidatus Lindowbacteria bacterium]
MWNSKPVVAVFGSSQVIEGDGDYEQARLLGRLLARSGFVVCNGGYTGTMEASARGAAEAGGIGLGLTLNTPALKEAANPYVTHEIKNASLLERLSNFLELAEAFVVLKGGVGTLTEFCIAWSHLQLRAIRSKPFICVGRLWSDVVDSLRRDLEVREKDVKLFRVVSTPDEAVEILKRNLAKK